MIIFDLDGTLADCSHRRHFVDPSNRIDYLLGGYDGQGNLLPEKEYYNVNSGLKFKPDWKSFYKACDKDLRIESNCRLFEKLWSRNQLLIWSGRCESVRTKTIEWLYSNININAPPDEGHFDSILKMRPIGDSTPDDLLKERWLDETYEETKWGRRTPIEFVVDDRPKVLRMWQRRGIFTFDVSQGKGEF